MKRRKLMIAMAATGISAISVAAGPPAKKRAMWKNTKFTRNFGLEYPIIQGPFGGGLSSVALTSTVSAFGGLGSFGGQPFTAQEIIATCAAIRTQTDRPFNINLWVNDRDAALDEFDDADYQKLVEILQPYFQELGLPLPERPKNLGPRFEEQIEAIFEAKPAVFSFVYGIPSADILERCRKLGIKTVGTATTADEAIALEHAGVDAVVATGFEAGGHRVSFLRPAEASLTGTLALIPQVADSIKLPIIAAGGIADARGIRAAFALGTDAVQIGTAFLATNQSNASAEHKEKLFSSEAKYTVLTKAFTGRLSRGIPNRLTEELKVSEHLLAPYPLQSKLMALLKSYPANSPGNSAFKAYWSGQSAPLLKHRDAEVLLRTLVEEMGK